MLRRACDAVHGYCPRAPGTAASAAPRAQEVPAPSARGAAHGQLRTTSPSPPLAPDCQVPAVPAGPPTPTPLT